MRHAISILGFTMLVSMGAEAACNRAALAGNYSASGFFGAVNVGEVFFTARIVLNAGGGLSVPIMRISGNGQRDFLVGRGSWSVNSNCVGNMRLFASDDPAGAEPTFIDFTVGGTQQDPVFEGVLTENIQAPLSGTITLRKMALR